MTAGSIAAILNPREPFGALRAKPEHHSSRLSDLVEFCETLSVVDVINRRLRDLYVFHRYSTETGAILLFFVRYLIAIRANELDLESEVARDLFRPREMKKVRQHCMRNLIIKLFETRENRERFRHSSTAVSLTQRVAGAREERP